MASTIQWISLQQVAPFTLSSAKLLIQFQVLGVKPDFVQVYADNYGATTSAGLGSVADIVDMGVPDPVFTSVIDVQAGAVYTIWLCPRTGEKLSPDDQTDGQYWEGLCVGKTIVTQSAQLPATQRAVPVINAIKAEPATLTQPDSITVGWTSQPYDKFLIWWTKNGEPIAQGEVDSRGTTGSWKASPTVPGARYTFSVKGGTYGGIAGNYLYSDWGPTVSVTAPLHYSSLRHFLSASGINPGAQGVRSLAQRQTSVRKVMKLG